MENMAADCFEVKKEISVCQGCLSSDRAMYHLNENSDLFLYLLGPEYSVHETDITLCWECKALLRNVKKFQKRIQTAQGLLQHASYQIVVNPLPLTSLTETVISKDNTVIIQEQEENDRNGTNICSVSYSNHINTNNEGFEENIECKEEDSSHCEDKEEDSTHFEDKEEDSSHYEDKEENSPHYEDKEEDSPHYEDKEEDSPHYEDTHEETFDEKPDNEDNATVKQEIKNDSNLNKKRIVKLENEHSNITKQNRVKKYNVKLKKTNNVIDFNNMDKYFKVVTLDNEEMDQCVLKKLRAKVHRCKIGKCKIGYGFVIDMRRHKMLRHMKRDNPSYECAQCRHKCATFESLWQHWRSHNAAGECRLCRAAVPRVAHYMQQHLLTHTTFVTCLECDVTFYSAQDFDRHYKELHKQAICGDCGVRYRTKNTLYKHIRRHHLPSKCDHCSQTYATYDKLLKHIKARHEPTKDSNPEISYCVECDKQFSNYAKYRSHIHSSPKHTPRKKVRLPCPDCGKTFHRRSYLSNHYILIHEKNSKHRCQICHKQLATASGVRKHIESVHEKVAKEKNKICDICGRGFNTNRILVHHRRTHTGERPHACPACAHTFAQRTALHTHMRTQHKMHKVPPSG